jgi:excisionase family DNA binding protein
VSNVIPFTPRPARTDTTTPAGGISTPATPAPVGRAVYTVKETAYLLSLSLGSTYALIRSGEIPAIKLGGRWLVPKRRLHEWVDGLPTATPEEVSRELDAIDRRHGA